MKNTDLKTIESFITKNRSWCERNKDDYPITKSARHMRPIKLYTNYKKPIVVFSKTLIKYFVDVREKFVTIAGCNTYSFDSNVNQDTPLIFLLGQKNNKISIAEFIPTNGGCGQMSHIGEDQLNEATYSLIKNGYHPAGLARVGMFNSDLTDFGPAFEDLKSVLKEQGMCFVSVGRTRMFVHYTDNQGNFGRISNYAIK